MNIVVRVWRAVLPESARAFIMHKIRLPIRQFFLGFHDRPVRTQMILWLRSPEGRNYWAEHGGGATLRA